MIKVLDKIHIIIALTAALVMGLVSVHGGVTLLVFARRLIVVSVLFYLAGLYLRHYLMANVFFEIEPVTLGDDELIEQIEAEMEMEDDDTLEEDSMDDSMDILDDVEKFDAEKFDAEKFESEMVEDK